MAEEKTYQKQKTPDKVQKKEKAPEKPVKKNPMQEEMGEVLVRVLGFDIPGSRNLYAGLTRIKGVSWAISNAVCKNLNMQHTKKISELTKDEIKKIEAFLMDLKVYDFMKNRRLDIDTNETMHLYGHDLDQKRDFDIKRMKKIRSYKGIRHSLGQPVRGQKTRSHFRARGRGSVGIKKNVK
jgi:small subunit ribosomal protein S13